MYDCDNDNAFFMSVWLVLEVIRTVRRTVCCLNRHSPLISDLFSTAYPKRKLSCYESYNSKSWQSEKMIKSLTFFRLHEHFYYKQGSG